MHTVFALLCFVVVIHWLIFPYPSGSLHWHCGNLTIAPVPAKQLWWIWINTSCEFIMNDCITTTKHSKAKTVCIFLGIYCNALTVKNDFYESVQLSQRKKESKSYVFFSDHLYLPHPCVEVRLFVHSWLMRLLLTSTDLRFCWAR